MIGENQCLLVATETVKRRVSRIVAVLAGIGAGSALLVTLGWVSHGVGIALFLAGMFSLWNYFGIGYQFAIRPYDFFATMGKARTPIKWSDIDELRGDQTRINVGLRSGRRLEFDIAPFDPANRVAIHQFLMQNLAVHRAGGQLRMPTIDRIESDRLVIRPFRREDEGAWIGLRKEVSYERNQLFDSVPEPLLRETFPLVLPEHSSESLALELAICLKSSGSVIGSVNLALEPGYLARSVQLGIAIFEEFRNQGFGSESISEVLDHLEKESNLVKVTAGCFADNRACIRALEKGGLRKVGMGEAFWFRGGAWRDGIEFERCFGRDGEE